MWIRVERGGGQPMLIMFKFYYIIIKSTNMDKGGEDAYPQNEDKNTCFFNPSLMLSVRAVREA